MGTTVRATMDAFLISGAATTITVAIITTGAVIPLTGFASQSVSSIATVQTVIYATTTGVKSGTVDDIAVRGGLNGVDSATKVCFSFFFL